MTARRHDTALDQLFRSARTRNGWTDQAVPEPLIRELYDLARLGLTSANLNPNPAAATFGCAAPMVQTAAGRSCQ